MVRWKDREKNKKKTGTWGDVANLCKMHVLWIRKHAERTEGCFWNHFFFFVIFDKLLSKRKEGGRSHASLCWTEVYKYEQNTKMTHGSEL